MEKVYIIQIHKLNSDMREKKKRQRNMQTHYGAFESISLYSPFNIMVVLKKKEKNSP